MNTQVLFTFVLMYSSRENARLAGNNLLDIRAKLFNARAVEILFGNHRVALLKEAGVVPHRPPSLNQISLMWNSKKNELSFLVHTHKKINVAIPIFFLPHVVSTFCVIFYCKFGRKGIVYLPFKYLSDLYIYIYRV